MPGRFDNSIVSQVRERSDIVDIISEHVSLSRKGHEMVGVCPFHEDHRPSMYVNPTKQIFKCFACGAGGGVFTFVQMRENLTFPQAIERLAERAGIKLQRFESHNSKTQDVDPNELAKVNEWAAKYFQKNLNSEQAGKSVRDYINSRQISPETVKIWRLGLAISGDDLFTQAKARKIDNSLLAKSGLITGQNNDKFVNRLMFPITDATGRMIAFGGRTLNNEGAKYINSPATVLFDKSKCLYGLSNARHEIGSTGTAVVVEGYMDCIMAHQFGCRNVVACMGTSFTDSQARLLKRYAKKVILVFDSDIAGMEAANRAVEICLSEGIDIKLTWVPQGKDPCDFLLSAGKEPFEQLLSNAVDALEYKWRRLTESLENKDTIVEQKQAIEQFMDTMAVGLKAGNFSPIEKGVIVNRLAKITGLEIKELNSELSKRLRRSQGTSYAGEKPSQKFVSTDMGQGLFAAAQREVLEVLLNEPKLFEIVKERLNASDFDIPVLNMIAGIVFDELNKRSDMDIAAILSKAELPELASVIAQLVQEGHGKGNFDARIRGAVDTMTRHKTKTKKNNIKQIDDQLPRRNPHSLGIT